MARNTSDKSRRQWWSTKEVADELGTSPRTVLDWTRDADLIRMGGVTKVGRFLRLHWPTVQRWLRQKTLESAPAEARDDELYRALNEWKWRPGRPGRPPKWAQYRRGGATGQAGG